MAYKDTSNSGNRLFNTSNPLVMLIILNALMFILLNFIKSIYTFSMLSDASFYKNIYNWFAMPGSLEKLMGRPWTIITMQFTELRVFSIISHLFWLWVFGDIVQDLVGTDKITPVYVYCGFASALAFVVSANVFFADEVGMIFFSGTACIVLGLAVAAATISPKYRFFPLIGGGIPLWIISAIYFLLYISSIGADRIFLIPALASALMGFVFIRLLKNGIDLGAWMNEAARGIGNVFTPQTKKTKGLKHTAFYHLGGRKPFEKQPNITQQKVDAILDKISQHGYDKLTEEEKKILKQASKEEL